jgi:hypothetical protein
VINICDFMNFAHPVGKPDAPSPTTNIGVRFASVFPIRLKIKNQIKTLSSDWNKSTMPSPFQPAAKVDKIPPVPVVKSAPAFQPLYGSSIHREKPAHKSKFTGAPKAPLSWTADGMSSCVSSNMSPIRSASPVR